MTADVSYASLQTSTFKLLHQQPFLSNSENYWKPRRSAKTQKHGPHCKPFVISRYGAIDPVAIMWLRGSWIQHQTPPPHPLGLLLNNVSAPSSVTLPSSPGVITMTCACPAPHCTGRDAPILEIRPHCHTLAWEKKRKVFGADQKNLSVLIGCIWRKARPSAPSYKHIGQGAGAV